MGTLGGRATRARARRCTWLAARASESRRALFRDCSSILDSDPVSQEAQAVADRWRALLDAETGGDEETKRDMLDAWSRAGGQWPDGMKRYIGIPLRTRRRDVAAGDRLPRARGYNRHEACASRRSARPRQWREYAALRSSSSRAGSRCTWLASELQLQPRLDVAERSRRPAGSAAPDPLLLSRVPARDGPPRRASC